LVIAAMPSSIEVPCHCSVLAASSAPLRKLLLLAPPITDRRFAGATATAAPPPPRRVELRVGGDALQALVAFVYGEDVSPPKDVAGLEELLTAAMALEVAPLVTRCADALGRAASTPPLACDALRMAHRFAHDRNREAGSGSAEACVPWAELRNLSLACIAANFEVITAVPAETALCAMRRHAILRQRAAAVAAATADMAANYAGASEEKSDTCDEDTDGAVRVSLSGSEACCGESFLRLPEALVAEVLARPELNCPEAVVVAAVLAWLDRADATDRRALDQQSSKQDAHEREELALAFSPFDSPTYDARRRRRDAPPLPWHAGPAAAVHSVALFSSTDDDDDDDVDDGDDRDGGGAGGRTGCSDAQTFEAAARRTLRALAWLELELVPAAFLHQLVEGHPRFAAAPSLVLGAYRAQALRSDRSSATAAAGVSGPGGQRANGCGASRRSGVDQTLPAAARAALEPCRPNPSTTPRGQWWRKWRATPQVTASSTSALRSLPAAAAPASVAVLPAPRAVWTPPPPSSPAASRRSQGAADGFNDDDAARGGDDETFLTSPAPVMKLHGSAF
jgi:hypothetical protein